MPGMSLVTVPYPSFVTLSWNCFTKVAVTDLPASMTTWQSVAVHEPLQPPNLEPGSGVAVSATGVPEAY